MSDFQEQFLEVTPIDSLIFRDGKPFSVNVHSANGIFPPFPYSFTGLLRTHFGKEYSYDMEKMKSAGLGDNETFGDFYLTGSYLKKSDELYFSAPADIIHEKNSQKIIGMLTPKENTDNIVTNYPKNFTKIPSTDFQGEFLNFSNCFISATDMKSYLKGNFKEIKNIVTKDFFVKEEPRTSVQIDSKKAAGEDGKLFTVNFIRFEDSVSFVLSYKAPAFKQDSAVATLGGERRLVKLTKVNKFSLPEIEINSNRIKLILTTPAFFNNMQTPNLQIDGLKLVSAVSNGYENIGGWDIVKCRPRPIRKAVKAGSVYYYEIESKEVINKIKNLNSLSDTDSQAGMGNFLIGGW